LLQIAGGIWADTVGGKQVLAFGVIWWSVATILTPVAAKLGLPFLLVARAFMGIGEVRSVKMFFVAPDIASDICNDLIHIVGDDTI
jgi:MFS family permease